MFFKPGILPKSLNRCLLSFLSFVTLLLITACSESEEGKVDALSFTVNPALLGEHYVDASSGFSLQAPINWIPVSQAVFQQISAGVKATFGSDSLLMPEILAVYHHPQDNAHLIAARYRPELTQAERDTVMHRQSERLRARYSDRDVLATPFAHRDCEFDQLLVIGDDYVVIKLFVRRGDFPMCHVEYVVPRSRYETHSRAIESSIGSISFGS
jgi:hypothetical protein